MTKCEKFGCIANLDGECVLEKCEGELRQFPSCPTKDREKRRKYYEGMRAMFNEDFPQPDIREQMREEGVCESDIDLALNTIEMLRYKQGRGKEF